MTLTHQPPFPQSEQLELQVNQVFDEFEQSSNSINSLNYMANIQIHQTPATVKLTALLPPIHPTQLKVEVIDQSVLNSGIITEAVPAKSLSQSQFISPFRWVVALPAVVASTPVHLDYINGILTLLLQKIDAI